MLALDEESAAKQRASAIPELPMVLKKSPVSFVISVLAWQIPIIGILILIFLVILIIVSFLPAGSMAISLQMPIIVILFAIDALLILILYIRSESARYTLDQENITFTQGWLIFRRIQIYHYAHYAGVSENQNFLGRMFGYGTITLRTEDPKKFPDVTLADIENPRPAVDKLQDLVNAHISNVN